jgi:hypothetical protein
MLKWEVLFVKQVGENEKSRSDYFEGKDRTSLTTSRIVQTEDNAVCVIGGFNAYPTLVAHDYEVARSCISIDLESAILTPKSPMLHGRYWHAVAKVQ